MIDKIWSLLTTFTPEAQQAAQGKCVEAGFDQGRGRVPLAESYINLNAACAILRDAIEKQKLIQLPITVQDELASLLEAISKYQTSLAGGTDDVVNLVAEIEKLNTSMWRYGFHNLSEEVLGYQTKLNQLKALEVIANDAVAKLQQGLQLKDEMTTSVGDAAKQLESIQKLRADAETALGATNEALDSAKQSSEKAAEVLTETQGTNTSCKELHEETTEGNKEVQENRATIKAYTSAFGTLKDTLEKNKATQEALFTEFENYRKTIDGLLGDANRTGMAASFTERRRQLLWPLGVWVFVFVCAIGGLSYMGLHYIEPVISSADWIQLPSRLALTAPLVWLGWFAAKQYGYTTRLREDYSYKEASAKSFEGYKREAGQVDQEMLKRLMETAIQNLGQNPVRIYNGHENHASPAHELLEKALKSDKGFDLLRDLLARNKA